MKYKRLLPRLLISNTQATIIRTWIFLVAIFWRWWRCRLTDKIFWIKNRKAATSRSCSKFFDNYLCQIFCCLNTWCVNYKRRRGPAQIITVTCCFIFPESIPKNISRKLQYALCIELTKLLKFHATLNFRILHGFWSPSLSHLKF